MSLNYKINCIEYLKNKGYKELHKLFGGSELQKMRDGEVIGIKTLNKLCELLELQPGDIIEYIKEKDSQ